MPPSIDDMTLGDHAAPRPTGVAFRLSDLSPSDWRVEVDSWLVESKANSRCAVACGPPASNYPDAWRGALVATQRALDVCCAGGLADLALVSAVEEHIVSWPTAGGQVLRVVTTTDFGSRTSASAMVWSAAGQLVPQTPPTLAWDESMRYYRESQLAADVFASTRSLWLAVENLLDSLAPIRPGDSEEKWLKAALRDVDTRIGLADFLPSGGAKAPHNAAYDYFYGDVRTHLFHANASRRPLLPHEALGTNLLVERHDRLTKLYLRLLESMTGVRRPMGVMTYAGFDQATKLLENSPEFRITDDPSPLDPAATFVNPSGGTVTVFPAARESTLEREGLKVFCGGTALSALPPVRKVGFSCQSILVAIDAMFGRLVVADIALFEAQMGFRLNNQSMPKYFTEM